MGADLIVMHAVLRKGKRPKWRAARQRVKALGRPGSEWPAEWVEQVRGGVELDDEERAAEAKQLFEELGDFRALWDECVYWRDVTFLKVGGHTVILTADRSWGDTWPTYELFERLWYSGVLDAAGFTGS